MLPSTFIIGKKKPIPAPKSIMAWPNNKDWDKKQSEIIIVDTKGTETAGKSNSNTEEKRTIPEKRNQSQKAHTKNRKDVHSSNKKKDNGSSTPFSLIRKSAGRYVISSNEGKQETDDKQVDLKSQTDSHSLLPSNCYNIMKKKSINIVK